LFNEYEQLTLFDDDIALEIDIDSRVKDLTKRFGELKVEKTVATKEW